MQSLIFFNKEGDGLNFFYDEDSQTWVGNLIFHENSDDTFKTIGLYVMEKIPSTSLLSDFKTSGATISLDKFQLFNEYGMNFYGSSYSSTQSITGFQWPNRDPNLKSRWVYGEEFDKKFPIGSQVRFVTASTNDPLFLESFSATKTYNVHKVKPNAILLLGDNPNNSGAWVGTTNFINRNISLYTVDFDNWRIIGVNSVGIYNYRVGSPAVDNLSFWSEPGFYRKYFVGRKLNIVNSGKNDGVATIKSISSPFGERTYQRYRLDPTAILTDKDFIVKVTLKTDVPTIYGGSINFRVTSGGLYYIQLVGITQLPSSIKPGVRIQVPGSTSNKNFLTVAPIQNYTDISTSRTILGGELVIYEGKIYKCNSNIVWTATASIFPSNVGFWTLSDIFYVNEPIVAETITDAVDLQLASNVFYYTQSFTQSVEYTYGSSIAKYSPELKDLNIDYYYSNNFIYCDLLYPEDYANVEFYSGGLSIADVLPTSIVGIREQNVEIAETITTELNKDISENFRYDIVFTDIDEFGIGPFCPNKNCDVSDNTLGVEPIQITYIPPEPINVTDNVEVITDGVTQPKPFTELKGGYVLFQGKHMHKDVLKDMRPDVLKLVADNARQSNTKFGTEFPKMAEKTDIFVRVDMLPNKVYKFDGFRWIQVNKEVATSYVHDQEYVKYLVTKIDSGEYDVDLLNDIERQQIEEYLTKKS